MKHLLEVVLWVGGHALRHDITGQAKLHRCSLHGQHFLQLFVQEAHVAKTVWVELQHGKRLLRSVALHFATS